MSKRAQKDATFRNQSVFMHPKRKTLNKYTANGRTAQRNQLLYNKYNETLKFAKDLLDSPGPHLHNAMFEETLCPTVHSLKLLCFLRF